MFGGGDPGLSGAGVRASGSEQLFSEQAAAALRLAQATLRLSAPTPSPARAAAQDKPAAVWDSRAEQPSPRRRCPRSRSSISTQGCIGQGGVSGASVFFCRCPASPSRPYPLRSMPTPTPRCVTLYLFLYYLAWVIGGPHRGFGVVRACAGFSGGGFRRFLPGGSFSLHRFVDVYMSLSRHRKAYILSYIHWILIVLGSYATTVACQDLASCFLRHFTPLQRISLVLRGAMVAHGLSFLLV